MYIQYIEQNINVINKNTVHYTQQQYQVMDEDGKLGEVHELQLTKDMTNAAAGNIPLLLETLDLFGNAQTDSADITNEPCKAEDNAGALIDPNNVGIPSLDTEELNEIYSIENVPLNAHTEKQPDHSEVEMQMMDDKGSIHATARTDQKEDPSLNFFPDMFDLFGNAQTDSADIFNEPCKAEDNAGALIDQNNVAIPSLDTEELNESYSIENLLLNAYAEMQSDHSEVEMQMMDVKGSIPATASTDQKEDPSLDFSPDMFDLFGDAQKESVDITTEPCKLVDNAGALIDPENVLLNAFAEKQPDHSKVEMQMTDDKGSTPATASTDQKEDTGLDFSPDMFFADW
ncbi:unnamed protein product [Acanthoscelides obtectus]|uniref:Uncharacterized protein n=1 Tax=Acanthoscelides obtectus TaxID=200917 RepID=A0A9P0QBK7_ACAOB|nr:unnamed protein product [Acanthoscelides obtectus]CAK1684118.1 hypothetical protein AOBTE_LOCUS34638 [Acanthoscelides obtectus]